jgi:hypothetical protein
MGARGIPGTPRPGNGYNNGGKRCEAMKARLKEIQRRQAAGEPVYGKPLPSMPINEGKK